MTIVGPPSSSSPPILPYPFLGYGPRTGTFTRGFEMSTSKEFTDGKLREAGLPKTKPPLPPRPSEPDRAVRRNEQTLTAGSAAADSVSVFGSKQSDVGDSDGIAFVDGTYILTLEHDDNHISVDRKVASMSPRGPT
ncbi:hypothetical protein A7U60_g6652 [Sanghuangporus baumii]|uniref:Uncharacterized protein n=1 Tax=Sanghuangporus baumii TaxID=108892 RepID=A0A9Q5HUP1_SANBA|nr:hypothetical protein A7U60_g6652 [Sanghuangporus baumii]